MKKSFFLIIAPSLMFFTLSFIIKNESHSSSKVDKRKNQMNEKIEAIMLNSENFCFTRFTISIPSKSEISFGRMTVNSKIKRVPNEIENFYEIINGEIRNNQDNLRVFSKDREFDKISGKPFSSSDANFTHLIGIAGIYNYSIHTFVKLGRDIYILETPGIDEDFVKNVLESDTQVAKSLVPRETYEIPKIPGICIDHAFATIEPSFENIEFGIRLKDFPDVHFSIQTIKNGDGVMPVNLAHEKAQSIKQGVSSGLTTWLSRLKTLREGRSIVNEWQGEEMLLRVPSGFGKPSIHKFIFRASGLKHDPLHPFVEITMDTGVVGNQTASREPSLSDEEALALWDRLLNSIRVRPNAVAAGTQESTNTRN